MVGNFAQTYYMDFDTVLDMTYQNVMLYSSVLPSYDADNKDAKLDASDPRNKDKVQQLLFG